jgi:hypothetical protein
MDTEAYLAFGLGALEFEVGSPSPVESEKVKL